MDETRLPPFQVTPAAVEALEALGGVIRIDLAEGGCCGTAYTFEQVRPDADPAAGEERYGCPGAWLVVSEAAGEVLAGARLDYGARLKPARFRVTHNPSTPHVCACRRSFGHPWPGPGQPTCWSYRPMDWDTGYEPPAPWRRRTGWERPT